MLSNEPCGRARPQFNEFHALKSDVMGKKSNCCHSQERRVKSVIYKSVCHNDVRRGTEHSAMVDCKTPRVVAEDPVKEECASNLVVAVCVHHGTANFCATSSWHSANVPSHQEPDDSLMESSDSKQNGHHQRAQVRTADGISPGTRENWSCGVPSRHHPTALGQLC